jgi:hypothetical protein
LGSGGTRVAARKQVLGRKSEMTKTQSVSSTRSDSNPPERHPFSTIPTLDFRRFRPASVPAVLSPEMEANNHGD